MKRHIIFKNIFVIALLIITFFKNVSGAIPLAEISLKNVYEHILDYSPEALLQLASEDAVYSLDCEYKLSRALITDNPDIFFPNIDGYPKIIAKFQDNRWLHSAAPNDQFIFMEFLAPTAELWTLKGKLITTFHQQINSATPDGEFVLITIYNGDTAELKHWKGQTITLQHDARVNSAIFSPDSLSILTASDDNTAKLWNLNGQLIATFTHGDAINSAVFSHNSQFILTASGDGTACLWNLNNLNREPIVTFHHGYSVKSAIFSPNGKRILTISDFEVKLWNLNGELITTLQHDSDVDVAVFSTDGQFIVATSYKHSDVDLREVILWGVGTLWNSTKYRNGQLSLQELATILLILKHKEFVNSDPNIQAIIHDILNQIDGNVPDEQRHIKNFFEGFLNS